jgi:hypothetical protein
VWHTAALQLQLQLITAAALLSSAVSLCVNVRIITVGSVIILLFVIIINCFFRCISIISRLSSTAVHVISDVIIWRVTIHIFNFFIFNII